jgi:hypothetical protein
VEFIYSLARLRNGEISSRFKFDVINPDDNLRICYLREREKFAEQLNKYLLIITDRAIDDRLAVSVRYSLGKLDVAVQENALAN